MQITNTDLAEFDSLLERCSNGSVVELNFSHTCIDDEELKVILKQIGENLKTLELWNCKYLNNFDAIKNCTQLQELSLSRTKITDKKLKVILNQIGGSLKALELWNCYNLRNFEAIRNCIHLQNLDLSRTNINDEQLASIPNQIRENLKALRLWDCKNLNNFEAMDKSPRTRSLWSLDHRKYKTAISTFKKAVELIVYGIQLLEAVESERINHKIFKEEFDTNTDLQIKQDWSKGSSNHFLNTTRDVKTAICNYAIILCKESYPEDLLINRNEISKNPNLYEAQMILKIIRNAMGHISAQSDNKAYPMCIIKNKKDRRLFEIKKKGDTLVTLDATKLHGQKFDYKKDLGGFENLFIPLKCLMEDLEEKIDNIEK